MIKYCIDCGKKIDPGAVSRCRICSTVGKQNGNWKGGRRKNYAGYVYVYSPEHPNRNCDNVVFEHRLVMEQKLGRYLNAGERVHHINEIKDDNCPENLELTNSSEHAKIHIQNMLNKRRDNIQKKEITLAKQIKHYRKLGYSLNRMVKEKIGSKRLIYRVNKTHKDMIYNDIQS